MNIITKLSIRQKVMLTLTVLAAVFLSWQIYNFVHGNSGGVQPINPSTPHPVSVKPTTNTLPPPPVKPLPAKESSHVNLTASQQAYLGLIREYQVTKIKRQILEEQASLASAQKRISDASHNSSFVNYGVYGDLIGGDNADNTYVLSYLDRQAGQWTATLNRNGQYQEVQVGSRLTDGSRVISINDKGVVLRNLHGKSRLVSFQGSVNVDKVEANSNSAAPSQSSAKNSAEKPGETKNRNNLNNIGSTINANNAKIAKILGITAAPPNSNTPGAASAPNASNPAETLQNIAKQLQEVKVPVSTDIPAAPLTQPNTPPPAAPPASAPVPPQSNPPAAVAPSKPVSVRELQKSLGINEASAQGLSQVSWHEDQQDSLDGNSLSTH